MSAEVKAFYYPECMADEPTVAKAILLFDELHFMDIAIAHEGDIRCRGMVGSLLQEDPDGGHARRVMREYEKWFKGTPELEILHLVGAFDRPAEPSSIAELRKPPPLPGAFARLQDLDEIEWGGAVWRLRAAGLLTSDRNGYLDCHPLVREYFGDRFRSLNPNAWRAAHSRLYEYFRDFAAQFPDTLTKMEPLFRAVAHGCQAGRAQEVLQVYIERIKRGTQAYSVKMLGLFGEDLAALMWFFDKPWHKPIDSLDIREQAAILNWAGFRLLGLGRPREAIQPAQAAFEIIRSVAASESPGPARTVAGSGGSGAASLVSEISLTLGRVDEAVEFGRKSVYFADTSGDKNETAHVAHGICRCPGPKGRSPER